MLHHECNRPGTLEGKYPCAHFIQDDAEGVDITACSASMALRLLGGHIQSGFERSVSVCTGGRISQPGEAKMRKQRLANPIGQGTLPLRKENSVRCEISVDDARAMGIIDGQTDQCKEANNVCA